MPKKLDEIAKQLWNEKNIRWNCLIVDENHTIHSISGWMLQFGAPL